MLGRLYEEHALDYHLQDWQFWTEHRVVSFCVGKRSPIEAKSWRYLPGLRVQPSVRASFDAASVRVGGRFRLLRDG